MSDCICVRSEWNAERTHIVNSFERDAACPIHGNGAWEPSPELNRWAAFTDDELDIAHTALALSPRDSEPLNHEVAAEIERRKSRT